jgi:hypothetical protein
MLSLLVLSIDRQLQIRTNNKVHFLLIYIIIVPDKRSRILEVVIVRRLVTLVLGIWRG